jgi:hypothetical protein
MHKLVLIILIFCAPISYASNELKQCFTKLTVRNKPNPALYELNTKCILPHIVDVILLETEKQVSELPYVLAFPDGSLIANKGDEIFATGLVDNRYTSFSFVNAYQKLVDPITNKNLGIQLSLVGHAELLSLGTVQRLLIKESFGPIAAGSRLIPRKALDLPATIYGVKPSIKVHGAIIGMHNYRTLGGNPGVVSLNLGTSDGLHEGDVLEIYGQAKFVLDPYLKKAVKLPATKRAELVVYKLTPKTSLGLIVSGSGVIEKFDEVVSFGDAV